MKKSIQLSVNGAAVCAEVEPRLQLADFLRDHLSLTGTHLGCEHGVCGACTVQIDGAPARSCIAYAVACNGTDVRTIEGFDADPVMSELREAFSAEHALQCGYCTPGMLITARDIVLRLPDADEARIRRELCGNLCRCTGYVGIVRAIQSVLAAHHEEYARPVAAKASAVQTTPWLAPITERSATGTQNEHPLAPVTGERVRVRGTPSSAAPAAAKPQTTLHESFSVDHSRDKVWDFFGRLDEVTMCLPGASVIGAPTQDHVDIKLRIKVGPIVPEFEGGADVVRDLANYSGTIRGAARDTRSSSTTRGEVRYVLIEEKGGTATRVEVDVGFTLTGALAQFSRSSIVQDIARRMTAAFAQNLQTRLNQRDRGASAVRPDQPPVSELDAGSLFLSVLWNRMKMFFRSLWRKK